MTAEKKYWMNRRSFWTKSKMRKRMEKTDSQSGIESALFSELQFMRQETGTASCRVFAQGVRTHFFPSDKKKHPLFNEFGQFKSSVLFIPIINRFLFDIPVFIVDCAEEYLGVSFFMGKAVGIAGRYNLSH